MDFFGNKINVMVSLSRKKHRYIEFYMIWEVWDLSEISES